MRAPVCVRCQRSMQVVHVGRMVLFNARSGPLLAPTQRPYEAIGGDEYGCVGCGARVVAAWAADPYWHEPDEGVPAHDLMVNER